MFITVDCYDFKRAFKDCNRDDNFSPEGLDILFGYFEEDDIELDAIGICCDYCESTLEDINQDYNQEFEDLDEAEEWLQDQTTVVGKTDDTIVFAQF